MLNRDIQEVTQHPYPCAPPHPVFLCRWLRGTVANPDKHKWREAFTPIMRTLEASNQEQSQAAIVLTMPNAI